CAGLLAAALVGSSVLPATPAPAQDKKKGAGGPKHVFSCPPPDHPFDVILARPTDTSVTVSVLTYKPTDAYITYGTESGKPAGKTDTRSLKPAEPAEFGLKGLRPDTRYFYRLRTRTGDAKEFVADAERSFHTQRRAGGPFVFTVQSDSHLDQASRPAVYERTLANALADRPDFHIDVGDTFMTDKYEAFRDALPQYVAQRYYFGRVAHSAPLFLVLGNHDGERLDRSDGTADCMPVWSCLTRKKYFPNPYPDGFYTGNKTELKHVGRVENYYAWEWGDALFVALDPFWTTGRVGKNQADGNWARTLGKEQYDWLAKTLANSKAKFKFVFIHHLVGGLDDSGRGGSEAAVLYEWGGKGKDGKDQFRDKRPGWEMPIHQLLVNHKVSAVFHGHDHFYAHQELDDVKYVMVPQPGHPGGDRLRNADEYGYVRGDFLPPAGHVRVSVTAEKATVEYIRTYLPQSETATEKNGHVAHSFTVRSSP
ncbi:MAG TPA: metallophosphoesterase family protein, partial [Gemmata sp.]